ncbi:MAG: bifunctional (p)ppGpp synthetase/guanosine-3',5'-bis(diphosphate) 3'-pyrophosphohydrolase, partial [Clostridia bacterium]|nr:bifunctional (p)ppGpp synthetase/guanosine-3',5'-bis(diphosphate) 3'-pyrophosphohydrolase [Clostridia bacterium]
AGIEAQINGRPKHLYSVYKKTIRQNRGVQDIFDLIAVRVIVNTINDCYAALGVIHAIWKPVPGRFKDYIAMPKPNMYRSLHTTLFSETGMPFEVQIRTFEMHRTAEYGIAAHWMYKEGRANRDELDSKLAWLREALELENYADNTREFVENIRKDFFSDYVYVLTPRGQIIDLVTGSTPLDFAYRIHSNVGNHAQHAKVNGAIVRLDYKLKNNDVVEIVTSPNTNPSRDWLKIVKTQQAKAKIRQWFKKANRDENIQRGKEMLSEAARRQGRQLSELSKDEYFDDILKRFNMSTMEDVYAAIGYGGITTGQVLHKLMEQYRKEAKAQQAAEWLEQKEQRMQSGDHQGRGVIVKGDPNMVIRFAHCCSPLPGDKIVGYITRGRGVSIHREDCPNMDDLMVEPERFIEVEWTKSAKTTYTASIQVQAGERAGLLLEISQVLLNLNISIKSMNAKTTGDVVNLQMSFDVTSADQLESIIKQMKKVNMVNEVYRINV